MNQQHIFFTYFMVAITSLLSPFSFLKGEWLIIDGTRNYSLAMVNHLLEQKKACTVIVKSQDMPLLQQYVPLWRKLTIVEADYTSAESKNIITQAAKNHHSLFLDPEYHDYLKWHTIIPIIVTNALVAAKTHNLTIYYPGRIYPFNVNEVITETSPHSPTTEQGKTLAKVEKMLQLIAETSSCHINIIRAGYPFGPGVKDHLLSASFRDVPQNGRVTWLFDGEVTHKFSYTRDVARLAFHLSTQAPPHEKFNRLNFAGYSSTIFQLGSEMLDAARKLFTHRASVPSKILPRIVSELQLSLISAIEPNALRGKDLAEYFTKSVQLDDSKLYATYPTFKPTPLSQALTETLQWWHEVESH